MPTLPTRLRVLMISDVYFPRVNGVSTSISTFRSDLAQLGCDSVLVAPQYPQNREDEAGIVRIPSRYVPFDPEDRMMRGRAAARACAGFGPEFDVVHIQTPFVAHKLGLDVARRLGCGTVESYHTYFEQYFHHYVRWMPKPVLQRLARALSRTQCNAVNRVVAPSEAMARVLRGYGVRTPIDIVPTGLDLRAFDTGDGLRFRAERNIPDGRPVMLHVGRVAHEKNIAFVIDVLDHARREVPDVLLVIAGEGPAYRALRRDVARRRLDEHVMFVGYLDRRTALLDCYRAADVLVFASNTETQGLVPLEAMAVGTPVVSTAVLGTAEIVGPGRGAVAVPEDVDAFARAVIDVLRQPALRESLGAQAREYVAECWSSAAMARRLVAIYREVAAARPAARADGQRETRVQFAAATNAPSSTNQISTHAGMLKPRNDQLTSAHSPEPVKTMRTASSTGNASNM
jgi:1,2-diacylglycerol 3-alpha-glucosyltransferase